MARDFSDEERRRPKSRITPLSYSKVIRELVDGPCRYVDLVDATGLSIVTVHQIIRALRLEGLVRVSARERDSKNRQTILVFEFKPDVPDMRFERDTMRVRQARRRQKKVLQPIQQLGVQHA